MKLRNAFVGASGLLLLAALALPATASADPTSTTFELTGGSVTMTVPGAAALNNAATGAGSVSGSLGTVSVTDARGGTAGWGVTAESTSFTGASGTVIAASEVDYAPGAPTKGGDSTVTGTPLTDLSVAATAVEATAVVGNNTASWSPTLTVGLPSNALAGSYSGTVTTSLL